VVDEIGYSDWYGYMNRETILVVEDNHSLREGLCETLAQAGYYVLSAANGREALLKMGVIQVDLILSDIAMPEMDGLAFFAAVRQRPEWITIPFIFLTARGEKQDIMAGKDMGAEDYLVKPVVPEELLSATRSRLNRSRQLLITQLQQSYEDSLTVLANAIELRDPYTRGHVERVAAYAVTLADYMGWTESRLQHLRFAGILHDIGKIHISEETLTKCGPLSTTEWQEMKQHPVTGAIMVKDISYLSAAAAIVRHHHEQWDGGGYPDGLAGDAIPMEARIMAVADSFDAMTTTRSYRPALSLDEAYDEIVQGAGQRYDPTVVAVFQAAWQREEIQSIRSGTNNGHQSLAA
jgi:putative two-component system response regulator